MPSSKLPVIWYEGVLGLEKRSRYGVATLLNEAFDSVTDVELVHCSGMADCPADATEAVVVIHGEHVLNQAYQVQVDLNRFQRSLVIVFCDEPGNFPTRTLMTPNRRIWQQMPVQGVHDFADRFMICGYPHDTQMHLANYDATLVDRPIDWFFAGQVTHIRRIQCVTELRRLPNGKLIETPGFWQGLERAEYFRTMAASKIVICPSGTSTPDTLRVAEALEAGCMPIVDNVYPQSNRPAGFWQYVLKCQPPFPLITDWSTLPQILAEELAKWPANRDAAMEWWKTYKRSTYGWMQQDIAWLKGR